MLSTVVTTGDTLFMNCVPILVIFTIAWLQSFWKVCQFCYKLSDETRLRDSENCLHGEDNISTILWIIIRVIPGMQAVWRFTGPQG